MSYLRIRTGTSMVEVVMFIAFFGIASSAVLVLLFGTNEQRKRQEGIALVDQTGIQLLQTVSRRVRAAERVLDPPRGASGTVLALQMAADADDPTIITTQSGVLMAAEYDSAFALTSAEQITVQNFSVRNTSPADNTPSVQISFTIHKFLGLPSQPTYTRDFEILVTLFPDDEQQGNDCNCSVPTCTNGVYTWQYCAVTTCTNAPETFSC